MDGIIDLPQYLLGVIAIILLPGPNSLYCLSVAGQHGYRQAWRAIAGVLVGDSLLILATVLGAATLLKAYPFLFHGIKLAGGLYLAWIGLNLCRGAWRAWQTRGSVQPYSRPLPRQNFFRGALVLSLMNPKAILFFLSFFTQFVRADAPRPFWSFFLLALILQVVSCTYLNALSLAGERFTAFFARFRVLAALGMGATGLLFFGFAFRLWMASL